MRSFPNGISRLVVTGFLSLGLVLGGCGKPKEDFSGRARPQVSKGQELPQRQASVPGELKRVGRTPEGFAQAVVTAGLPLLFSRQLLPVDAKGQLVQGNEAEDSAKAQAQQLVENLDILLSETGSDWEKLVRIHAYVKDPKTGEVLIQSLLARINEDSRPAFTLVETPLPLAEAGMALDVVAITSANPGEMRLLRCPRLWGEDGFADVAVVPPDELVFFSGYPERGEPREATAKVLSGLMQMAEQLSVTKSNVAQLKVFAQPVGLAEVVKDQLRELFTNELVPPVVFVEWIASAPVEIEMIAFREANTGGSEEKLVFYNPPGTKPSPTFSRATVLGRSELIFVSGLWASEAVDGATEVRHIFGQLEEILKTVSSDMRHLVKATYYVSGKDASAALDKLRPEYFELGRAPAASKAMVHGVGKAGRTITLDMIATSP